jgi:hypothetical protein
MEKPETSTSVGINNEFELQSRVFQYGEYFMQISFTNKCEVSGTARLRLQIRMQHVKMLAVVHRTWYSVAHEIATSWRSEFWKQRNSPNWTEFRTSHSLMYTDQVRMSGLIIATHTYLLCIRGSVTWRFTAPFGRCLKYSEQVYHI